jgi:hypothetical protein
MTELIVVIVCRSLPIAGASEERRSVETRIAEDTCEEHGVFCCPWCFGAAADEFAGARMTATRW